MEQKPKFKIGDKTTIERDKAGWYHGVGDGREVKIMEVTSLAPIETCEYKVMDNNGDFWHIPESDLGIAIDSTLTNNK